MTRDYGKGLVIILISVGRLIPGLLAGTHPRWHHCLSRLPARPQGPQGQQG